MKRLLANREKVAMISALPDCFRTNLIHSYSPVAPKIQLPEYTSARKSQQLHPQQISTDQPGNPLKDLATIIGATQSGQPPARLLLESDAYGLAKQKIESMEAEREQCKTLAKSVSNVRKSKKALTTFIRNQGFFLCATSYLKSKS